MSNKFENSEENNEEFVVDIENNSESSVEEINIKIEEELNSLEKNGAELVSTVDSIGGEEKLKEMLDNHEEKGGNIFKQVRSITLILGAISAIPMAYSIANPESFNKLVEAAENYPTLALGAIGVASTIYVLVEAIRSGELVKGAKETFLSFKKAFSLESFKKISDDRKAKKGRHERFIERNF